MTIAKAAALVLLLVVTGCKKEPAWKTQTYTEMKVKPQPGEVEIPQSLWTKILETQTSKDRSKAQGAGEHGAENAAVPETVMEPLKVYLIERNKGVLKGQNIALSFVAGGGQLNLADVTSNLRGSYRIAFEFRPEAEKAETNVFFLSNSVIRKVGGETVGSGCNTYFDLTKRFHEAMKHEGFLVNTSDQRDVSALAGTYVFTQSEGGKLHMAALIVKDDNHRALQCRR